MAKLIDVYCLICLFGVTFGLGQEYDDNHAKVLILGAGAAGLQAAKEFHDSGMDDLIIIEAQSFYGGRVHDVEFAGIRVETGANWAQPPGTSVIDQVKRLSIAYHPTDYDSVVVRNDTGHNVDDEADELWEELEQALATVEDLGMRLKEECRDDMSLRAALRLGGWMPTTALHKLLEFYEFDAEWADIPDVTSLRSVTLIGQIPATDGRDLFINDQGGFKRIFEEVTPWLMTDPFKNHLRLNQTVTSVSDRSDTGVQVTCSDGTKYTGDYALVTVSLGVLQNDGIKFTPALPDWKVEKFFQFIMASYTKVYIKFPTQFWDDVEWILHVSDRRGYYAAFNNLNAAGVYPTLPGNNILVGYIAGDEARRVQNQPLAETKAEVEAVLRNMYPEATVPEATDIYVTDWNTNPLFYGAYSNWPVEVSTEGFKQIQSRVGNLFFAGEHTHSLLSGFVVGAMESGEREAAKILDCMRGDDCPQYQPPDEYTCPTSHGIINAMSGLPCFLAVIFAAWAKIIV